MLKIALLLNHYNATHDYVKWYLSLESHLIKEYNLNQYLQTIVEYFEKIYKKNNSEDIYLLAQLYIKTQQFNKVIELYEKTSYLIDSSLQCILIYHRGLYKQKKDREKVKKYIERAKSIDEKRTIDFLIKNSII